MTTAVKPTDKPREFAAHFHLLGSVDYEDCLSAQRRLAYDAMTRGDGRMVVLLCEHPPLITIGRGGSRGDLRFTPAELLARQLEIRYVSRGGGTLLHGPGQLAIYPIVPLMWQGWTIGAYLRRLQAGVRGALADLGFRTGSLAGRFGLWGRAGLLAPVGIAVKHGTATHGAFLNVNPDMRDMRRIAIGGDRGQGSGDGKQEAPNRNSKSQISNLKSEMRNPPTFSSLLSEHGRAVKMTSVRAAIVQHLAEAFGCENYHLHTGHPLLADSMPPAKQPGNRPRESAA